MDNTLFHSLAFLLFVNLSYAQTNTLYAFIGHWSGKGTLFGQHAKFEMSWDKQLNNQFYTLKFHNEYKDKEGNLRIMNAVGYYKLGDDGDLKGHWFDSRGVMLPLAGTLSQNKLTILWGDESTEKGKTIYQLISSENINVEDYFFDGKGINSLALQHILEKSNIMLP